MAAEIVAPIVNHLPSKKDLGSYFPTLSFALKEDAKSPDTSSNSSPDLENSTPFASTTTTTSRTSSPVSEVDTKASSPLKLSFLPTPRDIIANGPRTPSRVDPNNPPWPAYRGYHEFSFAYATMGVRLPTILGKAIEDTVKTLNAEWEEEKVLDLCACIDRMQVLMEDLSGNR